YRPVAGSRISRPLFFSEDQILFSERDIAGIERLKAFSTNTRKVTDIFPTLAPAHSPELAQGGKGLTFVSEVSGVSNLYFAPDLKNPPLPLTNVETTVQNGAYSAKRQEAYLSRMAGRGMVIEKVKAPLQAKLLPRIQSQWDEPTKWPEFKEPEVKLAEGISLEPYAPTRYLWPQYWMPFLSFIPQGAFVQGSLASADPLKKHNLGLDLSYDTLSNKPSVAGRYTNQATRYPMGLALANINSYLYGAQQVIQNSSAVASMSFNLPGLFDSLSFVGAYSYLSSQYPVRDTAGSIVTETATRSGPVLGVTYSNLMQRGTQISPTKGYRLAGQLTYYLPKVGTVSYPQLNLDGMYFFSKWLPDRHALMARMNAVLSPNDRNFLLGTVSAGGEFFGSFIGVKYAVRGYPPGNFIGWSLVNTTLEYRMPLSDPMRGYLSGLFFLRNWHAAAFVDAAILDGAYVSRSRDAFVRDRWKRVFMGTGVEVRAESTALFHVPVQWRFGLFQGLDSEAYGGLTPFFGMVVEGLPI
ncbi:MAG: outer membrane protein assembly factor, partial [Bdellovibrionales bacterium]|nr:outer membrane protein assembly factor [Bdellovibrionales bacterium]